MFKDNHNNLENPKQRAEQSTTTRVLRARLDINCIEYAVLLTNVNEERANRS